MGVPGDKAGEDMENLGPSVSCQEMWAFILNQWGTFARPKGGK